MKYKIKFFFLLTVIVILLSSAISCGKIPVETHKPATTESPTPTITKAEIRINPPLHLNMFITPEITHQQKTFTIWCDTEWKLSYDADWLKVTPTNGTSLRDTKITVTTENIELMPGEYETEIIVESKDNTSSAALPVILYVISERPGQILDIPVEIELIIVDGSASKDTDPDAAEFLNPLVTIGTLKESAFNIYAGAQYSTGEPCIIVSGEFRNNTDDSIWLLITAEGYGVNRLQQSWSLSTGPLTGIKDYDIPAHSSIDIEILLSWANNPFFIRIIASVHGAFYDLPEMEEKN